MIRFGLNVFLFESLSVLNLSAATKNVITWRWYLSYRNKNIGELSCLISLIETSPFRANQWTGFFMIETSVIKELEQHVFY